MLGKQPIIEQVEKPININEMKYHEKLEKIIVD